MKKFISLLAVLVLALTASLGVVAAPTGDWPVHPDNPNLNPGVAYMTTDCGVFIVIAHSADAGQPVYAYYDGTWEFLRNETGSFRFTVNVFERNFTIEVHGNTLIYVGCDCICCNEEPEPETPVFWGLKDVGRPIVKTFSDTVRTVDAVNLGNVYLFQVNRNHPGPVPLELFEDRNGNVNFMRAEGHMLYTDVETIVTITIQRQVRVYKYSDGTIAEKVPTRPHIEKDTEIITTEGRVDVDSNFIPYDAGTTGFSVQFGNEDLSFDLLLNVRGNTTLLDTSTAYFTTDGEATPIAINGSWFRVMSGDEGPH